MLCASLAAPPFKPSAELPDLLTRLDGSHVTTKEQWAGRRGELKTLLQEHILGNLPEAPPPPLTHAELLNTSSSTACSAFVRLAFDVSAGGATSSVSFDVQLAWPCAAKETPIFLTQWNHRNWGMVGVQRGYLMALYPGADTRDVSSAFRAAYPNASFHKILARAYVASRVIDALLSPALPSMLPNVTLPRIDASRICISGHSRNGKQSLVAAAFDERITAVVGSSPGTPIAAPVRFSSPDFNGEGVDYVSPTRDWWLPSLRDYLGREHALPADGHMVLALIAPRACLLATAMSDGEGDVTFAGEMNVVAARDAFALLGASERLRIRWRPGRHAQRESNSQAPSPARPACRPAD